MLRGYEYPLSCVTISCIFNRVRRGGVFAVVCEAKFKPARKFVQVVLHCSARLATTNPLALGARNVMQLSRFFCSYKPGLKKHSNKIINLTSFTKNLGSIIIALALGTEKAYSGQDYNEWGLIKDQQTHVHNITYACTPKKTGRVNKTLHLSFETTFNT